MLFSKLTSMFTKKEQTKKPRKSNSVESSVKPDNNLFDIISDIPWSHSSSHSSSHSCSDSGSSSCDSGSSGCD